MLLSILPIIITSMNIDGLHLHWRSSRYKGKTYKSYSLARPYRENGKNKKEILLSLGKLSDKEAAQWRNLLKAVKKPDTFLTSVEEIVISKKYAYLDIVAIHEIWNECELDRPFERKSHSWVALSMIALILTINRCLHPLSKSLVCSWVKKTWLPWMCNINVEHINPSRIFRALTEVEECKDKIGSHLYHLLKRRFPQAMNHLFYDLSSATFSGTQCILMNWGHCKEGYQNHIVLALVVNEKGLPFYWEVLEGNTADSKTITWLLEKLGHKFPHIEATLVFDRGMVSDANLTLLEQEGYKYISAMDRNQISRIVPINFKKYSFFKVNSIETQLDALTEFKPLNQSTYYQEVKLEKRRRYILCFNPQLFKDQRNDREKNIQSLERYLKQLNEELATAKKSRDKRAIQNKIDKKTAQLKLKDFIRVSLRPIRVKRTDVEGREKTIISYQGTLDPIDKNKRIEAEKLDGFWLLVTNHYEKDEKDFQLAAAEAINPYREKVIIETAFRDIKSFVEVTPIYVWTEDHVKAHFTICVLAYFINRILTMKLHDNKGNLTQEIITHEKLYEVLSDYTIDKIHITNMNISNYKLSFMDKQVRELVERVGLLQVINNDRSIKMANERLN